MRVACWISNATETHTEYVILIAVPRATIVTPMHLNFTSYVQFFSRKITTKISIRKLKKKNISSPK